MWNFWGCPSDFPEITVRYPQFFKLITSLNPRHALSHFRSHEALEDLEKTAEESVLDASAGRKKRTSAASAVRKKRTSAVSAAKVAAAGGKKRKGSVVVEHEESVHEANSRVSNDGKQVGVAGPPWQILDA